MLLIFTISILDHISKVDAIRMYVVLLLLTECCMDRHIKWHDVQSYWLQKSASVSKFKVFNNKPIAIETGVNVFY